MLQTHYILQVLDRFGMSSSRPVTTPMTERALGDVAEVEGPHAETQLYQELLGCLLFISIKTRPDI